MKVLCANRPRHFHAAARTTATFAVVDFGFDFKRG